MRKIISYLFSLLFVFSISTLILRADEISTQYSNVVELYEYWEANGYPDYIGGVFSTDGGMDSLTVLLVGGDDSIAEKIRDSLADDTGISFESALFSYNAMRAVQDEITANYMEGGGKIYRIGVGWTSIDGKVTGFGESRKEFRVVVSVDKSKVAEYTDIFYKIYGQMVVVEEGSAMSLDDSTDVVSDDPKPVQTDTALITMMLNGQLVTSEVPPYIENGRTMVPVRFISEALGAKVDWDGGQRLVMVTASDGTLIKLAIGDKSMITEKSGVANTVIMDTAAVIKGERTYVPVKYIAVALGLSVDWHGETRTVAFSSLGFNDDRKVTVILNDTEHYFTSVPFGDDETMQKILNTPNKDEMHMKYWGEFFIDVFGAETIKMLDYIYYNSDLTQNLLFETDLSKDSNGIFSYNAKHSSQSLNHPARAYGWNEMEKRTYLIIYEIGGQKYGCRFSILHNGSHL